MGTEIQQTVPSYTAPTAYSNYTQKSNTEEKDNIPLFMLEAQNQTETGHVLDTSTNPFNIKEPTPDKNPSNPYDNTDIITKMMSKTKYNTPCPDFVGDILPEEALLMASSMEYLDTNSIEYVMSQLPKRADGSIDTEKVKAALNYAVAFIQASNQKALEKIEYGVYGNQANDINIVAQTLTPEVAQCLRACGLNIDSLSTGIGLHDITPTGLMKILSGGKINCDEIDIKTAGAIKENIELQNAKLNELLNLDLDKPENIEKLLSGYKEVTGTNFSPDRIFNYQQSESLPNNQRFNDSITCFGIQQNLLDSFKNVTSTNAFVSTVKYLSSSILLYSSNPVAHVIGCILPFQIEYAEMLTKGCKEGELINTNNLTLSNFIDATSSAALTVAINHIPFWGSKICCWLERIGLTVTNGVTNSVIKAAIN